MAKQTVLVVIGTRPEAIKMAPVILRLRQQPWVRLRIVATAQHRELLDQVLQIFGIVPDVDLNVMRDDQQLAGLTARLLEDLDRVLDAESPDAVLAQGDTTTVLATALACFYRRISFGHVEAGLRTGDMDYPFPEEMNRVVAGRLARWHFAPTTGAADNLRREGMAGESIHVTGNTVIDALQHASAMADTSELDAICAGRRLILVTAHRRENFGPPLQAICKALRRLAESREDVQILLPVHPNPNVSATVRSILADCPRTHLCAPLDYLPFVAAMKRAHLVLTDSGGVQEEAPALAKPVLVLRTETERPEAVDAGVVKLVGSNEDAIVAETVCLLDQPETYRAMARGVSPYGDGHAAARIADILRRDLVDREDPCASC